MLSARLSRLAWEVIEAMGDVDALDDILAAQTGESVLEEDSDATAEEIKTLLVHYVIEQIEQDDSLHWIEAKNAKRELKQRFADYWRVSNKHAKETKSDVYLCTGGRLMIAVADLMHFEVSAIRDRLSRDELFAAGGPLDAPEVMPSGSTGGPCAQRIFG